MTLKGIEQVPGVLNFDQRAIVLSDPTDVIVTRESFDSSFLDYLEGLGYDFSQNTFLTHTASQQTYDSIFNDQKLLRAIQSINAEILDTYHLTSLEEDFAKKTGKKVFGNIAISDKYGTKSGFRQLALDIGMNVVPGRHNLMNAKELRQGILSLKGKTKTVLVRLDEGLSGAGNFLVDLDDFLKKSPSAQNLVAKELLLKLPQRLSKSGATAEVWIEDVISSPSLQYIVYENGEIELLSSHDQVLEGKEKWYVGCIYPSVYIIEEILEEGMLFMKTLQKEGFVGYCGLDLIITPKTYYFVEANVRKPGTTYPREFVRKVFGSLQGKYYYAKDIKDSKLIGKTFSEIYAKLIPLVIKPPISNEGILLYNTGALKEGGRFDVVVVSPERSHLETILLEVLGLVNTL
jgi:hypothetical protein